MPYSTTLTTLLETSHNARIVFDPSHPDIDLVLVFNNWYDWKWFNGEVSEPFPQTRHHPHLEKTSISACLLIWIMQETTNVLDDHELDLTFI